MCPPAQCFARCRYGFDYLYITLATIVANALLYSLYRRWWNCQGEFEFLQRVSAYRDMNSFLTVNESAFTFADAPE